jgi:hypothetical protein
MAARKRIDVGKNYRDNGFSPEDAPSTQEIRAFSLEKTAGPLGSTEYIPKMWNPDKGFLANITGDIDGLYIVNFAGGPLSLEKKLKILQRLWEIGWQHPETLTWIKNGEVAFASKSEIEPTPSVGKQPWRSAQTGSRERCSSTSNSRSSSEPRASGSTWSVDSSRGSQPRRMATLDRSRAHSSAGERPLHTREVPGSIPGAPTTREPAGNGGLSLIPRQSALTSSLYGPGGPGGSPFPM